MEGNGEIASKLRRLIWKLHQVPFLYLRLSGPGGGLRICRMNGQSRQGKSDSNVHAWKNEVQKKSVQVCFSAPRSLLCPRHGSRDYPLLAGGGLCTILVRRRASARRRPRNRRTDADGFPFAAAA